MEYTFALPDKFKIINNQINIYSDNSNIEKIFYKNIEKIFDDLDTKKSSILLPSIIHQIIWFYKINISYEKINTILNNNLLENRNKFRNSIKKNILTMDSINKFIVKFINKITYINDLVNSYENNLLENTENNLLENTENNLLVNSENNLLVNSYENNLLVNNLLVNSENNLLVNSENNLLVNSENNLLVNSYENLGSFIITDSIIIQFIEELIIKFRKYIIIEILNFLNIIKDIKIEYYNKIINIIKNTLENNFIINYEIKLSSINLTNIYNLNKKIKYYHKVIKYYNFIDFNNFILNITDNIEDIISNTNTNIKDINFIFTVLFPKVYIILNNINNNQKDDIICEILNKLINKIDKNTFNIIFKIIINILNDINMCMYRNVLNNLSLIINNFYIEEYVNFINDFFKNTYDNNKNNYDKWHKKETVLYHIIQTNDKWFINHYPKYYYNNALLFFIINNDNEKLLDYYYKKLLNRLIFMYDNNLDYFYIELIIIKKFDRINTKSYYNKLHKLISDVIKSYNYNNNYNYKILIVSHIWNLNDTTLNLKSLTGTFATYLNDYEKNYLIDYNNKIIKWLPHYGKIIITYLNIDIIMLPIQFIILELFETNNLIKFDDIFSIFINSNYDNKFQNDIINSLIKSKIIFNKNSYLILNDNPTFENNLIDIFYDITNNNYTLEISDLLQFSMKEVIEANINSILKLEDLDYTILFNKLTKKINLFVITDKLFNETLDIMLNKDLIQINDNKYKKIFY